MVIDFTSLNKIAMFTEEKPKEEPKDTPAGDLKGLQAEADRNKQDREKAREVYNTYQKNIKLSEQIQTDILKGIKAGTDITFLFLQAVKVISLMTSNQVFYTCVKDDLKNLYGIEPEQEQEQVK